MVSVVDNMKTHHYIYETTNKIDGKKYIGRRSTNNNPYEDTYLGSGKVLKRAINKYGRENFTKNIICLCNSFCELKVMEENILRLYDVASDQMYYNLNNSSSGFDYGENNVMKQPEISVKVAGEKNGNYGKGLFGSNNGEKLITFGGWVFIIVTFVSIIALAVFSYYVLVVQGR